MKENDEPPTCPSSSSNFFQIGRNSRGNWVVQDQRHLCGGLFTDRAAALKFAMFESGGHPRAVIMMPGIFELDMGSLPQATHSSTAKSELALQRVA